MHSHVEQDTTRSAGMEVNAGDWYRITSRARAFDFNVVKLLPGRVTPRPRKPEYKAGAEAHSIGTFRTAHNPNCLTVTERQDDRLHGPTQGDS